MLSILSANKKLWTLHKRFVHFKNLLTHQAQTEKSWSSVLSHGLNVLYVELQFNSLHAATVHADVSMLMSYSALEIWLWSSWSIIMIMWSVWSEETLGCWVRGSQASAGFSHSRLLHWPIVFVFSLNQSARPTSWQIWCLWVVWLIRILSTKFDDLDFWTIFPACQEYLWEILKQTTLCMAECY